MKRYIRAAHSSKYVVYYNKPVFIDTYDKNADMSDYGRTPTGSDRYAVSNGAEVIVKTVDTESEAERACNFGIDATYPDGTPFIIDLNYYEV